MPKVKDVIRDLSEYDPNDVILVAWWSKETIEDLAGEVITLSNSDIEDITNSEYDWSEINDQVRSEIDELIRQRKIEELKEEEDQELWDTEKEKASV